MNRQQNQKKRTVANSYKLVSAGKYTGRDSPSITFIDPHRYVSLRYNAVFTTSIATLVGSNQIFNLNSLFDPDRSGIGHQPYGYDQLAAIYNRYRVLRVHWRVTMSPSSLSYFLVVLPLNGLLASAIAGDTSYQTATENPRATSWVLGASGQSKCITGSLSLNDLNGCTRVEYLSDDRFEAQIGASPAEVMTLNIGLYNGNGSTIVVTYQVELTYEVDLHDVISLSGS